MIARSKNAPYAVVTPQWDDLMVAGFGAKVGGVNPPSWTKFRDNGAGSEGVFAWDFSATQEQSLYFSLQLPHAAVVTTDWSGHVHWSVKTATSSGSLIWGLEYTIAKINSTFGLTTIIKATHNFSTSAQYGHRLTSFSSDIVIPVNNTGASMVMIGRFFRDAANDTFSDVATLIGFDFHVLMDSIGSDEVGAKIYE